jgi:hypothetical protein
VGTVAKLRLRKLRLRCGARIGARKLVRIGCTAGRQQPIVEFSEPGRARHGIASARNRIPYSWNRVPGTGNSFTGTGNSVSECPRACGNQSAAQHAGTWR